MQVREQLGRIRRLFAEIAESNLVLIALLANKANKPSSGIQALIDGDSWRHNPRLIQYVEKIRPLADAIAEDASSRDDVEILRRIGHVREALMSIEQAAKPRRRRYDFTTLWKATKQAKTIRKQSSDCVDLNCSGGRFVTLPRVAKRLGIASGDTVTVSTLSRIVEENSKIIGTSGVAAQ